MEEKIIIYDNIKPIYSIDEYGNIKNINSGNYLKYAVTTAGYYTVGLQQKDNSRKTYYIHILVAEMFLPKSENSEQVNHKDKNRSNNHISNLEWCTQLENLEHQFANNQQPILAKTERSWGKISRGSENGMSKINEEQCRFICELLSKGFSRKQVLEICSFEVSYDIIRFIHKRKRWRHISKDYKW